MLQAAAHSAGRLQQWIKFGVASRKNPIIADSMRKTYLPLCCGIAASLLASAPAAAQVSLSGQIELLELHVGDGDEHFTFDGRTTASIGNVQAVLRFEGGSDVGPRVDNAELRPLLGYSLTPNVTLMAGMRQDIRPGSDLSHGTMGVEANIASWLSAESYAFVSERGDLTGDAELVGSFSLSGRLTLEPRIGVGWSAQNIPLEDTADGLTDLEASVRLRHAITPAANVYVGAIHERLLGGTRAIAEANGDLGIVNRVIVGVAAQF